MRALFLLAHHGRHEMSAYPHSGLHAVVDDGVDSGCDEESAFDDDLEWRLQQLESVLNGDGGKANAPTKVKRTFRCEACGVSSFATVEDLVAHRRDVHGSTAIVIPAAGEGGEDDPRAAASAVPQHERPYACQFCDMRFNSVGARNSHRRKVRAIDGRQATLYLTSSRRRSTNETSSASGATWPLDRPRSWSDTCARTRESRSSSARRAARNSWTRGMSRHLRHITW